MIDRPSGSWLVDENGNLTPNMADHAMAARYAASTAEDGVSAVSFDQKDRGQTQNSPLTDGAEEEENAEE